MIQSKLLRDELGKCMQKEGGWRGLVYRSEGGGSVWTGTFMLFQCVN